MQNRRPARAHASTNIAACFSRRLPDLADQCRFNADAPLGIVGLILVAGSLVLLWFVILSGLTDTTPLNRVYFLRADTAGISGARRITQWTYFYFCGDGNRDCSSPRPAPAFGRAWNREADNVPDSLFGSHGNGTTSSKFFYMWRFGWVFFLITLFFETFAFFGAFLACCGRLGAAISGLLASVALFFLTIAAALMTYVVLDPSDIIT
jgi:hypothetical protein